MCWGKKFRLLFVPEAASKIFLSRLPDRNWEYCCTNVCIWSVTNRLSGCVWCSFCMVSRIWSTSFISVGIWKHARKRKSLATSVYSSSNLRPNSDTGFEFLPGKSPFSTHRQEWQASCCSLLGKITRHWFFCWQRNSTLNYGVRRNKELAGNSILPLFSPPVSILIKTVFGWSLETVSRKTSARITWESEINTVALPGKRLKKIL